MPIKDLQITGTDTSTIPVRLHVTSGILSMTKTSGLTFTGDNSGQILQFSGTVSDINTDLKTLQYLRNDIGTDSLEVSLVNPGEVYFPDNGHVYEYISSNLNWNDSKTNAETKNKYGATGYLATFTSSQENDFVSSRIGKSGWIGANDLQQKGNWKWVTGPENGTQFWSGNNTGASVNNSYSNWNSDEPKDINNGNCVQSVYENNGKWTDSSCTETTLPGYIIEYGTDNTKLNIVSKNISITTLALPSSLGPENYVDGLWGNKSTPTLNFTLPNTNNTLQYKIQIDDNPDFSSPVIDYTSATGQKGLINFTVGQDAGSGTYTVGSVNQLLVDGSYYWRVSEIDNQTSQSIYITANNGNIAFKIDTTAPTTSGTPLPTNLITNNNLPTWSWTTSTDNGSGLTNNYIVRWSTDNTFTTNVYTATVNTNTFTHTTPLSDGTWYFYVTSTDNLGNTITSQNGSVVIDTIAPMTPTNFSINGTTPTNITKPSFKWDDEKELDGIAPYEIQYSNDSTFNSNILTVTSKVNSLKIMNALTEGTWYFRIRSKDSAGNYSQFSSSYSIIVDTTSPTNPGTPTMSIVNDIPVWNWVASTDTGSGFKNPAYKVEWSQSKDFSVISGNATTNTNSYIIISSIDNNNLYFRVKAIDNAGNESIFSTSGTSTPSSLSPTPTIVVTTTPEPQVLAATATPEPTEIIKSIITSPPPKPVITDTETPVPTTTIIPTEVQTSTPELIKLNSYNEYLNGSGKQLDLNKDQKVQFSLDKEEHTITLKEVHEFYIIVTIASTPTDVRVNKGESVNYDVNKDGKDDINLSLIDTNNDSAKLTFKALNTKVESSAAKIITTPNYILWAVLFLMISIAVTFFVMSKRNKSKIYKY